MTLIVMHAESYDSDDPVGALYLRKSHYCLKLKVLELQSSTVTFLELWQKFNDRHKRM